MVTTDRATRLLVSICSEAKRQITEMMTRPERNMTGFNVGYPPQKKDANVAEISARTIKGFR